MRLPPLCSVARRRESRRVYAGSPLSREASARAAQLVLVVIAVGTAEPAGQILRRANQGRRRLAGVVGVEADGGNDANGERETAVMREHRRGQCRDVRRFLAEAA